MFSRMRMDGTKVLTFQSICAASAERGCRTRSLACLWGGEKGQSVVLQWRWTHFDNIWQMFVTDLSGMLVAVVFVPLMTNQRPLLLFAGLCFTYNNRTSSWDENQLLWSEQRDGGESDPEVNREVRFDIVTFLHHYFHRAVLDALKRSKSINFWCWLFMVWMFFRGF